MATEENDAKPETTPNTTSASNAVNPCRSQPSLRGLWRLLSTRSAYPPSATAATFARQAVDPKSSLFVSAYCVVAKESVSKQISIAFLERVKADFKKRYGGGKADTAVAKSLNKEFGPVMKEHMKYIIDHAEEIEKLIKVKAQVSEVKSIMLENIDKAMDRGENLTVLADKTETLHSQAQDFRKKGTQIRRKMWYQNMKIKLVVLGILLFLVLVIWLSVCHGFSCSK